MAKSLRQLLSRWMGGRGISKENAAKTQRARRLFFQELEERKLMAIDVGVIGGAVNNGGFAAIVSQLNNDSYFDFNAVLLTESQADTIAELNAFDAVVIGNSGLGGTNYSAFETALRSWTEAGGGVVSTGFIVDWAVEGSNPGIAAVVPVNLENTILTNFGSTIDVTNSTHAITSGVTTFTTASYIEGSLNGADIGSTTLATSAYGAIGGGAVRPSVVAGDLLAGRTVYLGPAYSADPGSYSNVDLRSGMGDRLLEQSVAWAARITGSTVSAVVDGSGNLTISDNDAAGRNNQLSLSTDGTDLIISDAAESFASAPSGWTLGAGGTSIRRPLAGFTGSITVNGGAGNDTLTINNSVADVIPNGGITFNGGNPTTGIGDALVLTGGTTTSQTFNFTNEQDGSVVLGGAIAGTITYTGLEPVTSTVNATDVILNYSDGAETITMSAAGAQTQVDSDVLGETVTFTNPTGTLQIFGGTGADTANDIFNLNGFGPGLNAAVTINGRGGTDTVNLNATGLTATSLNVTAETIAQTQGVTVSGTSTLDAGAAGAITLANSANNFATVVVTNAGTASLRDDGGFVLGGTTTATSLTVESAGAITQTAAIAGTGGLTKLGGGTMTLSLANTYSGPTTLSGGIVNAASLANGGAASAIGQSSNAAGNLVFDGGTLRYTGATGQSTDRLFTLTTNGGTIDSSSATAASVLAFTNTGSIGFTGSGARTLTLTGSNIGVNTGDVNVAANNRLLPVLGNGVGGNVNVTKSGGGSWFLSGGNSYAGSTQISTGHLGINNSTALGTSAVNVAAGAQLAFSATGLTVANNITLNGLTTYNWSGTNMVGALIGGNVTGTVSNTLSGTLTLAATSNVNTAWSDKTLTISGKVTGTGALQMDLNRTGAGAPNVTLSNTTNDYSGGTILNSGILRFSDNLHLGNASGGVTFNGGTLSDTATTGTITPSGRTFTVNAGGGTINLAGSGTAGKLLLSTANQLTGSGTLTKTGGADLQISTTQSTFTGAWVINGGFVEAQNVNALGNLSATNTVTIGAGELVSSGINIANNLTLNAGASLSNNSGTAATYSGTVNAAGAFTVRPRNFQDTTTVGRTIIFSNAITGAGSMTIDSSGATSAGTVRTAASNLLSDTSTLIIAGNGIFDTQGFTDTIGGFQLVYGSLTGSGTLTTSAAAELRGGVISGTISAPSFTKNTSHPVQVLAANRLGGTPNVTVSAGNLLFGTVGTANSASQTLGTVTVNNGANLSVLAGGTITSGVLTLNGFSNLTSDAGAGNTATWTTSSVVNNGGKINVSSGTLDFGSNSIISNTTPAATNRLEGRLYENRTAFPVNTDAGIAAALSAAPANRVALAQALNFGTDALIGGFFGNTNVAGNVTNFSTMWVGTYTTAFSGAHQFSVPVHDDGTAVWIDLNNNGIFETAGSLGNERALDAPGTAAASNPAFNIPAAGTYRIAILQEDTTGGSSIQVQFAEPGGSITTLTDINPAAAGQAGRWNFSATAPFNTSTTPVINVGPGANLAAGSVTGSPTVNLSNAGLQERLYRANIGATGTFGANDVGSGASPNDTLEATNTASLLNKTPITVYTSPSAINVTTGNGQFFNDRSQSILSTNTDNFAVVVHGNFNVGTGNALAPTGQFTFGLDTDDQASLFVDSNDDGVFQASERLFTTNNNTNFGTTPSLVAGNYRFAIAMQEGGGNDRLIAKFGAGVIGSYAGLTTVIDPTAAAQAGIWTLPGTTAGKLTLNSAAATASAVGSLIVSGTAPAGTIDFSANNTVTVTDLTVGPGATLTRTNGTGVLNITNGQTFGTGSTTNVNAGTTNLQSAGTGTGAVNINNANTLVSIANATATSTSSAVTVAGGGRLEAAATNARLANVAVNAGGFLRLSSTEDTTAGATVPTATILGTLEINNAAVGANFDNVVLGNGATVVSVLAGANYASDLTTTTGTVNLDSAGGSMTLSGVISGGAGLTKVNANTVSLTAIETYTGATTVNGGVLAVNGSITSNVTVNSGGTLGGSGTVNGNVTSAGTGVVNAGNSPGTLIVNGNYSASTAFEVNSTYATAGTDYDQVVVNGALNTVNLSAAAITFVGAGGGTFPALPTFVTLIQNNTSNPTTAGVSPTNGSTVTLGGGVQAKLFYNGGDGNDVVLVSAATPTVIYIDDSFTGNPGQLIAEADLGTIALEPAVFGVNAFTSIGAAQAAFPAFAGNFIVNGGAYTTAVTLSGTQTITVAGTNTAQIPIFAGLTTTGAQTINILGVSTLTIGDASNLNSSLATVISGAAGGLLTKAGSGTLTLSGANTYTGLTTISAGTVLLGSATALGATAGSTTVASGAVLDLNGQTVGAEALNVSGTGIATNGALINSNATAASLAGDVTSAGGGYSVGGTGAITLTGNVQSNLTKVGGNTLTLGGTIDNGGLGVTVTSGTVILAKNPSTGGVHAVGGGGLVINGGTVQLAGTGGDQLFDGGPGVTVNAGGTFDVNGQTETIVGLNGAGTINNTNGTGALTVNGGGTFSGLIQNTSGTLSLTKTGAAALTLSGVNNSFSGGVNVNGGTLNVAAIADSLTNSSLGSAGNVTISGNATLNYTGAAAATTNRITSVNSGTINLAAGALDISSSVGGGVLTKTGGSALTLSGSGDNGGLGLTANAGTVILAKASSGGVHAIGGGALTINSGATVRLGGSGGDQIYDAAGGRTIAAGGTLDLNGLNESLGSQTLTVAGTGVGNAGAIINSNATAATLTGAITNNTFSVGGTGGITLNGVIGGAGDLTKVGANNVMLNGANTYTGATNIASGTLTAANSTALGATAAGTSIAAGATLALQGGIAIGAETITIAPNVTAGVDSLVSVSGDNSLAGNIIESAPLAFGNIGIRSDANTLTLNGSLTANGEALNFGGAGNIIVTGAIVGGSAPQLNYKQEVQLPGYNLGSYYQLDETSGTVATDSGPAPLNNGTYTGAVTLNQGSAFAPLGSAVSFAGGTVTLTNANTLGLTNASFTVMTWINATNIATDQAIFGNAEGGNNLGLHLNLRSSRLMMGFYADDLQDGAAPALSSNTWYHVAWTYNAATNLQAIYLNGAQYGATRTATNDFQGTGVLRLGNSCCNGNFTGLMDEAAIFNKDLSPAEVAAIYGKRAVVAGTANVSVAKSGAGVLSLANANTYSGGTTVNGGTLLANNGTGSATGSGAVAVNNAAVLGGTGSVAGAVTLNGTSTLAPGNSLTVDTSDDLGAGGIGFAAAGTNYNVRLDGTATGAFDQTVVNGAVTLGAGTANLNVSLGYTPAFGDSFKIIDKVTAGAISGTFAALPEGKVFTSGGSSFQITYQGGDGNDVVLTTINPAAPALQGTPLDDIFQLAINGGNVDITLNGNVIYTVSTSTPIALSGLTGDDLLTVNYTNGVFGPVTFNGNEGSEDGTGDELTVTGNTFTGLVYAATGDGAGTLTFSGASAVINFSNLEPVTVTSALGTVQVDIDPGNAIAGQNTATITDAAGVNMTVTLSAPFESMTFSTPTAALIINGDNVDNDIITIASVDADGPYRAPLTINGQGGAADVVSLNAALSLGNGATTGSVTVTAEAINIGANISTDLGTNAGGQTYTGAVSITANAVLDTDSAAGTDANVSFSSTVRSPHFYQLVASNLGWVAARAAALTTVSGGLTGYLATITSAGENNLVRALAASGSAWIGGTDNAAISGVDGKWIWADGPEAGQQFWQGLAAGTTTAPSFYANWNAGEPNGGVSEDFAEIQFPAGGWNDLSTQTRSSVIEFGALSSLTVVSGGGSATFGGSIGDSGSALNNLTVTAATINVNGTAATTINNQVFNGAVNLGANVTQAALNVNYNGTVNSSGGARSLTSTVSGVFTATNGVGTGSALSTTNVTGTATSSVIVLGNVTTTGTQTYTATDVFLGGTLSTQSAAVAVNGDLGLVGPATITTTASGAGAGVNISGAINNAHYYQFVNAAATWTAAQAAANATVGPFAGLSNGYLATPRSLAENAKVRAIGLNNDIWIGATDQTVEGEWRWANAADSNTLFWLGAAGGTAQNGQYTNWNGGEPNNSGNEDYANLLGGNGLWNDLPASSSLRYVMEFSAAAQPFVVTAGTGAVVLQGAVGALDRPTTVNLTGGSVSLGNVQTVGTQTYTGTTTLRGATYSSAGGALTFNSAVNVSNSTTIATTDNGAAGAAITFGGTVNGTSATPYQVINTGNISWSNARAAAKAAGGWLATITSAAENAAIVALPGFTNAWIGATDNAAISTADGRWIWADGPEAGIQFWQGLAAGAPTAPFNFANWNGGEPNGGGAEDYGQIIGPGGSAGRWNDLSNGGGPIANYILEFTVNPNLTLTAGTGTIGVTGAVGGTNALGAVTVNSANDVTFSSTIRTTGAVTQVAGTGTTTFNGTSGTGIGGALGVTTSNITFNTAPVVTVGAVNLSAVDNVAVNAGAGLNAGASTITIAANTNGDATGAFTAANGTLIQTTNGTASAVAVTVNMATGTGGLAAAAIQSGAAGTVTLNANGGAITDTNAAATNVTGGTLLANAATGINLDSTVNTITATNTAAGAISIDELDAVTLTNVTASNGLITITAGGTITATNVVSTTDNDANDITLTATAGNIALATVNAGTTAGDVILSAVAGTITGGAVTGDVLTATSAGGVSLNTTVNSLTATASAAGSISLTETNAITLTNLTTAHGPITVTAGGAIIATNVVSTTDADANDISLTATTGDITLGVVNAGTTAGDVTLTATAGNIIDAGNDAVTDVTGDAVSLTAGGDIGQVGALHVDTAANTLTTASNGAVVAGTHGTWINEANAVTVTSATTTDGVVVITAAGAMDAVLVTAGGAGRNALLTTTAGDITVGVVTATGARINAAGAILDGNLAGNNVTATSLLLQATTGIGVANELETTVANVAAANTTAGAIRIANTGAVDVTAVTLFGTTLNGATNNNLPITLTATGAMTITQELNAGIALVALASGGAILDGNAAANNVTGGSLIATAAGGITLDTTVSQLAAANTTSGDILITNTGGLNITTLSETVVGTVSGVTNPAGSATVIALSPLTVSSPVSALGSVILTATDNAAVATDNLSVNATVTSTGSSVTLNAGDNATISANLSAATTVAINIDANVVDPDPASGGALLVNAPVVITATAANVTGNTQADSFDFYPQATTPINVFGLAPFANPGGDTLLLHTDPPTTNPTLNILAGQGAGLYTFGNRANVQYSSIEQATTTTPIHVALDAGATGIETIRLQRSNESLPLPGNDFEVYDGSNNLLYAAPINTVLSFLFTGSGNANTVTISDANGLVDLAGTVPAPTGVGDNGNVAGTPEIFVRGNGGADALVFANGANNTNQTYGLGTGTGPGAQAGEVLTTNGATNLSVYFDGLEGVTSNDLSTPDTGALTIVGDANANAISVASAAGGTTVSATGYVPFTFGVQAFSSLTVNAGDGADPVTLASLNAGEANLAVTLNGEIGNDAIVVESAPATSTVLLQGGAGNDAYNLGGSLNTVDGILAAVTIADSAGTDSLTLVDSADTSGDTVTITDSTINGVSLAPAPNVTFTGIEALDVTTSGGDDTITTTLNGTNGLVSVNVRGAGGDDNFFLATADGMATLTTLNLIGDAGSDDFGSATNPIRPLIGPATNIAVYGDSTAITTNPGGAITDHLFLDMTTTSALATVNPLVIVDTVTGQATAANTRLLRFGGIDDIDLYDGGVLTDVMVGDLYVRATDQNDTLIFYSEMGGVRVNHNGVVVNNALYAPTNRIVAYGRAGADYMEFNFTLGSALGADFRGEADNDTLVGGLGADTLVGGGGSDILRGGESNDILFGEDQFLTTSLIPAAIQRATGVVQPGTLAGNDTLEGGGGNDILFGSGGDDVLSGGLGNDYVHGGDGNDILNSNGGNDILRGEAGADLINGGAGVDIILGGAGDDRMFGRAGRDFMLGGLGADQLQDDDAAEDVSVSGGLSYDADDSFGVSITGLNNYDLALQALMFTGSSSWTGSDSFATRVSALNGPFGTMTNDGVMDIILGAADVPDFVISNANDWQLNTQNDQLLTL